MKRKTPIDKITTPRSGVFELIFLRLIKSDIQPYIDIPGATLEIMVIIQFSTGD